jgi:hypothetical protein
MPGVPRRHGGGGSHEPRGVRHRRRHQDLRWTARLHAVQRVQRRIPVGRRVPVPGVEGRPLRRLPALDRHDLRRGVGGQVARYRRFAAVGDLPTRGGDRRPVQGPGSGSSARRQRRDCRRHRRRDPFGRRAEVDSVRHTPGGPAQPLRGRRVSARGRRLGHTQHDWLAAAPHLAR